MMDLAFVVQMARIHPHDTASGPTSLGIPSYMIAGTKTRKLIACCSNRIINVGAPEAAFLKALITAAQRKAIVISAIPSESL